MYYCLIASLEQFTLQSDAHKIDFVELRAQIAQELTRTDSNAVELLGGYYDVQNLVAALSGHTVLHSAMGNLSANQVEQLLALDSMDGDIDSEEPIYIAPKVGKMLGVIRGVEENEDEDLVLSDKLSRQEIETLLFDSYYRSVGDSSCGYLKRWVEYDRLMRLYISVAGNEQELDNELLSEIKEQDWFSELKAVLETKDFVQREHKMDALRWEVAEVLTEPGGVDDKLHDFDVAAVLCYLIKLNILQRWAMLSKEIGRERFEKMVNSFTAKGKIDLK